MFFYLHLPRSLILKSFEPILAEDREIRARKQNNLNTMFYTVVGDNINIMKTTFKLYFDLYQAFKQHGYTKIWKQREDCTSKSFSLTTCKLVIRKKLVNN